MLGLAGDVSTGIHLLHLPDRENMDFGIATQTSCRVLSRIGWIKETTFVAWTVALP